MKLTRWFDFTAIALVGASASATAQPSQDPAGADNDDGEIVVTAQLRQQSIADVPISITVLGEDELQARAAKNLSEIQGTVPGIYFSGDTAYASSPIAIRGTGGSGTVFGDEPVAVYVDGVYLGRSGGFATTDLLDVSGIEVVRGPQGTLQGRNATAGAVLVRSRDPGTRLNGYVRTLLADPQEYRVQAAVGGPIAPGLGARIAFAHSDERGWAKNVINGDRLGSARTTQARGTLLYEPSKSLRMRVSADWSESRTNPAIARFAATPVIPAAPAPFVPTPQVSLPQTTLDMLKKGNFALNDRNITNTKAAGVLGDVRLGLGSVDLVSLTAYRVSTIDGAQDSDATGARLGRNTGVFDFSQFSQELRLQSSVRGPLEWTAGGYFFLEKQDMNPFVIYNYLAGAPNAAGPNGRTGTRAEFRSFQDTKSIAIFGDARYEFLPRTGLTLGGRYTWEEKAFTVSRDVFLDLLNVRLPAPTSTSSPERTENWDNFSYRVVLDHRLDRDSIVYLKYSTGFKSGGFNAFGIEPAFDPEELKSWEIGFRSRFLDRRLSIAASAYVNDYSNLQIRAGVPAGGVAVTNAADSKIKGFEVEGELRASPALTFDASLAYTDATFSSFTLARDILDRPIDATGNRLPRVPKWQYAAGASYRLDIGSNQLTSRIGYRWRDEVFFYQTDQNLPTFRGDSVGELDARFDFGPADERWSLGVFGRNLTDEFAANNVTPLFSYPVASFLKPRTIGLEARFKF